MRAGEMSRADAVALVQRIMDADHASDDDVDGWPDRIDRAPACPYGHAGDLVFRPPERKPSADEGADQALTYRPIRL
ncbi:e9imm peptide [Streptomyces sp. G35A]